MCLKAMYLTTIEQCQKDFNYAAITEKETE